MLYIVERSKHERRKEMSINLSVEKACDDALSRVASGDHEALSVIYDALGRKIYMIAYSILGNKWDAEDVMQQTFMNLITSSSNYKKGSRAKSYILKTAHNLAINQLKDEQSKNGRVSPIEEDIPFVEENDLSSLESLKILGEEDRMIVVLKIDTNATHREIAELLGIGVAACEKRYRRALKRLKEYYKN